MIVWQERFCTGMNKRSGQNKNPYNREEVNILKSKVYAIADVARAKSESVSAAAPITRTCSIAATAPLYLCISTVGHPAKIIL